MTHYEIKSSKELRAGMGEGLVEAGKRNSNVVALSADVKGSVKMDGFAKEFPERFIQCGIAEANMVGIAAGLSLCGKVPFIGGFAEFVTGRIGFHGHPAPVDIRNLFVGKMIPDMYCKKGCRTPFMYKKQTK